MVFSPNAAAVRFGKPGKLTVMTTATLAGLEGAMTVSSALTGGVPLGYTTTGSAFSYNLATAKVDVAEELDSFATVETGRTSNVTVVLAETTYKNLKIAYNGGLITADGQNWTVEPPDLGDSQRLAYVWDENGTPANNSLRLILRNCLASGNVNRESRKGATIAGIPVTLECDITAGGLKPFKWFGSGAYNL